MNSIELAWKRQNDRVSGRKEGQYGEYTNQDWQDVNLFYAEAARLQAELAADRARVLELSGIVLDRDAQIREARAEALAMREAADKVAKQWNEREPQLLAAERDLEIAKARCERYEIALRPVGQRLATQDNRMTENPMFCVQQKRRQHGLDFRWSDNHEWVRDGEIMPEGTRGAEAFGYVDYWETVMVAFTEEGCKEYLRLNGHNLHEPRIYVESFNRCPEMIAIREAAQRALDGREQT